MEIARKCKSCNVDYVSHNKEKEKLHDSRMPEPSTFFNVDDESSGFEQILDEEFGIVPSLLSQERNYFIVKV